MSDHRDDFIIAIRYALLKKGAKQKFSSFFLILLCISTIALDRTSLNFMGSIRSVLNDFIYKVAVLSSQPAKLIKHSIQTTNNHFNVYDKNKNLNNEIELLKQEKYNNAYLSSENDILKTALLFSEEKKKKNIFSETAKVILDQKSPFLKSVLINKGTKSGIVKGMSVFHKDYLLGTVIETNYLTSRVLLLTDLNSKLPIIIENTDVNAILEGTGNHLKLNLSYLPDNYEIEIDKIIFTSGKDGFLTPGIPVAKTYLNKKNEVSVKLLGDPNQALFVNITNGQLSQ